jgi:hypothetical protein
MKYKMFIISVFLFSLFSCQGKTGQRDNVEYNAPKRDDELLKSFNYSDGDIKIFKKYIAALSPDKSVSLNNIIIRTALFFKDRPYVAHTLEKDPEQLVVNLREVDCTTFVETVLALSRTIKQYPNPAFENFCGELQKIRYRNGNIQDYTSRIHYFSDWIFENERGRIVKDVTKSIGGEPYMVSVSYMSSHPESYRQLKEYPKYVPVISQQEKEISGRNIYSMIPKNKISLSEKSVRNGDIVCFVTDIKGLDISHTGFLYFENGILTFIHASSQLKKVIVHSQSLTDYVSGIKSNKGIMVVRPV